jgi:hypothetical protein
MTVNVQTEEQAVQEAVSPDPQPQQITLSPGQEPRPGGAMAPRPEWIAPPAQQLVPIDRDLIAEIEELAGKEEAARFLNDLVRQGLQARRLFALEAEFAAEVGPLTDEDLAWARAQLWPK